MTRLSEAVSVTDGIRATVDEVAKEAGEDKVTRPVMEAAAELADAAGPLAAQDEAGFAQRKAVDTAADRCIGGVYDVCASTVETYEQDVIPLSGDQSADLDAAKALGNILFPDGLTFLKGRWIEQYGVTEMMLARAADPATAAQVDRLGLKGRFALLGKIHEKYGAKMGFTKVRSDDKDTPLARWHETLEVYMAAVFFGHRRDSKFRERLLAPYETAAVAARDARRKDPRPADPK